MRAVYFLLKLLARNKYHVIVSFEPNSQKLYYYGHETLVMHVKELIERGGKRKK